MRTVDDMDQRPAVRIGTAERERAQNALSEHFSEGRLDVAEFEERVGLAVAARTYGDLEPIFADMPGGLAALFPPPVVPAVRRPRAPVFDSRRRRALPAGALLFVVLLLVVASHGWMFFLFFPLLGAMHQGHSPNGRRTHGPGPSGR